VNSSARNGVQVSTHGQLPSGAEVALFTLTNARGHIVSASEYGCTLVDIVVPDSVGQLADVNLGYPGLAGYVSPGNPYFGCTIGRCANRIARGQFELDGVAHQLAKNDGPNHEHGGVRGFDKQLWTGRLVDGPVPKIRFALRSPEGQEGYPGNLDLCVELTWTDADALVLEYRATTDRATLVNLTNHCYFNLSGAPGSTVENHYLRLAADYYTVVDDALLPTGEIKSVIGTPLDFRRPRAIGAQLLRSAGAREAMITISSLWGRTVVRCASRQRLSK
jgi:aldose 1-epimerase